MEDENLVDVAVDTDTEVQEDTNINEDGDEETVDYKEEYEKQQKANTQILARAKRAEDEVKRLKTAQKTTAQPTITQPNPELSEELKLIARGLSDDEIEQAKVIAKGKGIKLTEAVSDKMFVLYQKEKQAQEKRENAKLGASKGSGEALEEEIVKPDMTRDEHIKAFQKVMGN